jgi:GNAT superfamily N-acetyltransferase
MTWRASTARWNRFPVSEEAHAQMTHLEFSLQELTFKPVTLDEWEDLQSLFTGPGVQQGCWCVYWRIRRDDFQRQYGEANRLVMEQIIQSGRVPGLLAYLHERPIGWCSVAPREEFPVLDRSRTLKRVDDRPVWSIVCFFVSKPYRRSGLSKALLRAAIDYARGEGACIIEAYPLILEGVANPRGERYMGLVSTFQEAGFEEAVRRSKRRSVMRLYLQDASG